jgi:hypothetical protein
MRNNRIRVFTAPSSSTAVTDFNVATNGSAILTANLDAQGIDTTAQLLAVPNEIVTELVPGTASEPIAVRISRPGATDTAYAASLRNGSTWATLRADTDPRSDVVEVLFSAEALGAGTYRDTIVFAPKNEQAQAEPVEVALELTVRAGVAVNPANVSVTILPCDDKLPAEVVVPLEIGGTAGMSYTLTLDAPVPWLQIDRVSGSIPDVAQLRVLPDQLTGSALRTGIGVDAHGSDVLGHREYVPISVLCAQHQLFVPLIARE